VQATTPASVSARKVRSSAVWHLMAVALVVQPLVATVSSPEVDHLGVREQRGVHGVIRVVVSQDHVRDRISVDPVLLQGTDDQVTARDHARVDDDGRRGVQDERDGAGHAVVADVASMQDVDLGRHAAKSEPTWP
jgi:hypothetical protein